MKVVVVMMMTLAIVAGVSSAATHIVGDRTGWTVPPSASFYSNWAAKQTFRVGDVLVFNFPTGAHTVGDATKSAYDSCTTTATLTAAKTTAPANYTLSKSGTHYFICTVPTHCTNGQKLAVTVGGSLAAAPAGAPEQAPAAGPSTAGASAPATEGTTASGPSAGGAATPPPGSSNAVSSAVAGVSMLSLVALAVSALF